MNAETVSNFAQLQNNTNYKFARTISFNSKDTNFTYLLNETIHLNPNMIFTAKMNSFSGWNTIVNVDSTNNLFRYSTDNGTTWKLITIPQGAFDVTQIRDEIKRVMVLNNDWNSTTQTYYIDI